MMINNYTIIIKIILKLKKVYKDVIKNRKKSIDEVLDKYLS